MIFKTDDPQEGAVVLERRERCFDYCDFCAVVRRNFAAAFVRKIKLCPATRL